MQIPVELIIENATPADVFGHLATLDRYPSWMRLVHRVEPVEPDEGRPAWWVELRARVGAVHPLQAAAHGAHRVRA